MPRRHFKNHLWPIPVPDAGSCECPATGAWRTLAVSVPTG
jgi:hypothetical protein